MTFVQRHRVSLTLAVLLAATGAIYLHDFDGAPVYLGGDETRFGSNAHAIATTGRDLSGRFMPLFVNTIDSPASSEGSTRWYQPALFYLQALVLTISPLSESSIRVPTTIIGILDVLLVYLLARQLFPGTFYPMLAALMLAMSPAHLMFSRQALDYICPLPLVIGWLFCLALFLQTGGTGAAVAAGVMLGIGFFTYIASWVMMPLYLLLTWLAQFQSGRASRRTVMAAGLGLALPLLVLIPWLWRNPEMVRDTIGRYKVYDVRHQSPLQGAKDFLNYNNIQERVSVYWDYFNPAFLFLSGGSNLTTGTRKAGVFLWPVSVFLVAGIYDRWRERRGSPFGPLGVVLVAALALAPMPATLVDERYAIQRELFILPIVALLSVYGVALLLRQRLLVRLIAVLLLAIWPIQYTFFFHDYFNDYRIRSAYWFDPVNFRDVAEYVIGDDSSAGVPAVYLSRDLDDGAARWEFYLAKHGREDLRWRTEFFGADSFDITKVPAGSLLVFYAQDPKAATLVSGQQCVLAKTVMHAGGSKSAVILRKSA